MRTLVQGRSRDAKLQQDSQYYFSRVSTSIQRGKTPHVDPVKEVDEEMNQREQNMFGVVSGTQGLNFDKYENIPVQVSGRGSEEYPPLDDFGDATILKAPIFLRRNISLCGYKRPTPVQRYAIPSAVAERDIMCCAQTGSGKTAAFLLPLLLGTRLPARAMPEKFTNTMAARPMALVLAPTRELATQIFGETLKLSNRSEIVCACVYGGASLRPQLDELSKGVDVLVATPGRLIDLMERGIMSMESCRYLCLDEADRMLDMGFEPQIRRIVQKADMPGPGPNGRQTLMFSATFPTLIQKLAGDFMSDYLWIGVGRVGSTTDNITQQLILTPARSKNEHLMNLLGSVPGSTLVFVAKKKTAGWLFHFLNEKGIRAAAMHGDRTQVERERALADFKSGKARVLVATDVASRGIDVTGVSHVINYDMPSNIDDYVHRIGRTARAGHTGLASALFVVEDCRDCNMNVATPLLRLLKENNQEVPEWFNHACANRSSGNGKANGNHNSRYGGTDYRRGGRGGRGGKGGGYRGRGGKGMGRGGY